MVVVSLRRKPSTTAMIAITNRIWIKLPAAYAKVPIAQPITRMTAMIYNSDLMMLMFYVNR
jgi:hypothetical protein